MADPHPRYQDLIDRARFWVEDNYAVPAAPTQLINDLAEALAEAAPPGARPAGGPVTAYDLERLRIHADYLGRQARGNLADALRTVLDHYEARPPVNTSE